MNLGGRQHPEAIGEYLSALSNSAVLHDQQRTWLVWGVRDGDHAVVGTSFKPRQTKVGNQDLEGWLSTKVFPRLDFRIYEFEYIPAVAVVMLEIFPCWHTPVRFCDTEFIQVGSTKHRLKDYPEKERQLWDRFRRPPFEKAVCMDHVTAQRVLELIDYPGLFELLGLPMPEGRSAILEKLVQERVVTTQGADHFHITNLGAILFAKRLTDFETLARKAICIIIYKGRNRVQTLREQVVTKGYASSFEGMVRYINEGAKAELWERFTEFDGTKLKQFPVVEMADLTLVTAIQHGANAMAENAPEKALAAWSVSGGGNLRARLSGARLASEAQRQFMIAWQEELDWQVYAHYGLIGPEDQLAQHGSAAMDGIPPDGLTLGGRAFEIRVARQMADGELETTWFERHKDAGSKPITELPAHWPDDYRALVERRLAFIEENKNINLIERPEYKRRWNTEPWAKRQQAALEKWLLTRLETYFHDADRMVRENAE